MSGTKGLRRGAWTRGATAAVLALGAAGACLPVEETDYGELRVRVVDQAGQPVAGSRIEPRGGWQWSSARAVEETGSDGRVVFSLPPARYEVDVYPPNFEDWRPFFYVDTVFVGEGGLDSLTFQFNREPGR